MPEPQDDVLRKVSAIAASDVREWLVQRQQNCYRIAEQRYAEDRDGWLEDAAYFSAAIGLIDWTAARRDEN